jgi:periplasmic protein TonB
MHVTRADTSSRFTAAVTIGLVHALAIYAIAGWSPGFERASSTPLLVQFISQVESRPLPPPPRVNIVVPAVKLTMPQVQVPEIALAPTASDRAITVATVPLPSPPVTSTAAPKLISQVEYVREPEPHYPTVSRRLREQGLVVLKVEIDERGTACNIEIESSSGYTRLDAAAREAVSRALFRPYVEDGAPRRALVLIPIEFSLARA